LINWRSGNTPATARAFWPTNPTQTPDGRKIDHSALVLKGGLERLQSLILQTSPA
jgi:hypothetical protein